MTSPEICSCLLNKFLFPTLILPFLLATNLLPILLSETVERLVTIRSYPNTFYYLPLLRVFLSAFSLAYQLYSFAYLGFIVLKDH